MACQSSAALGDHCAVKPAPLLGEGERVRAWVVAAAAITDSALLITQHSSCSTGIRC